MHQRINECKPVSPRKVVTETSTNTSSTPQTAQTISSTVTVLEQSHQIEQADVENPGREKSIFDTYCNAQIRPDVVNKLQLSITSKTQPSTK